MENNETILHDTSMEEKAAQVLARREAEIAAVPTQVSEEAQVIANQHIQGANIDTTQRIAEPQVKFAVDSAPISTMIPRPTTVQSGDSDVIPPPPSDAEMVAAGFITAADENEVLITSGPSIQPSTPIISEGDDESTIITKIAKESIGKGMPMSAQDEFVASLLPDIAQFRKDLIINEGYSPEEATIAARNRAKKNATEASTTYAQENPNGVIITIDKTQEDDVKFTAEEERKIQKAQALKLIVVENTDLETLKILPRKIDTHMSTIRSICGSLSQYSIPMPGFGDYVTFYGAQSAVLAGMTADEDDSTIDVLDKKASLLFNYFGNGTILRKTVTDEKGKERNLTYEEFCNTFKYEDIDLGIFGIVCASSMETTTTTYMCQNDHCKRPYEISYNQKAMLDMSEIPDIYKERVSFIDDNRANEGKLRELHDQCMKHTRLKSPMTKNVYEFYSPSISDVRHVMSNCMDLVDAGTALDIALLMYIDRIFVYDAENDGYIEVDVRLDPRLAFDTICRVHQIDLELLFQFIGKNVYRPMFKVKTKCPHCKREEIDEISVDNMVFLHARATLVEIDQ